MIPIKINRKKYKIPAISELTIKQFKEVFDECLDDDKLNYLKYLSKFTGIKYKEVINTDSNNINITKIAALIGVFDDFKTHKPPKRLFLRGQMYEIDGLGLDTIGKEYQYTSILRGLEGVSELDSLQWLLAVQFGDEDDVGKAQDNYKALDSMNWLDAFSASWFFFRRSTLIESSATRRILRLIARIKTRTRGSRSKPE
jgi:hypothetical protein